MTIEAPRMASLHEEKDRIGMCIGRRDSAPTDRQSCSSPGGVQQVSMGATT